MKLSVTFSPVGMPRIELYPCPERIRNTIRAAVACQYIDDERYILGRQAGAFLQGFSENHDGWVLVEFWQPDYQPFVDLLERLIAESDKNQAA